MSSVASTSKRRDVGPMKPRYSRRKDGCQTCRVRRVRCAGVKPICDHCKRLNHVCRWPEVVDLAPSRHQRPASTLSTTPEREQSSSERIGGESTNARRPVRPNASPDTPQVSHQQQPDPQDTLVLLSQLASQDQYGPTAPSFVSPVHHQQPEASLNTWHVSPTSLNAHIPSYAPPTDPVLQNVTTYPSKTHAPHIPVQAPPAEPSEDQRGSIFGTEFSDPNQLFGGSWGEFLNDNAGFNGNTIHSMPNIGDDLNFNLFFGLDTTDPNPPASITTAATASIFGGAAWDGWTEATSAPAVPATSMQTERRFCSPVTPEAIDQPIIQYFVGSISHIAITRRLNTPNYYLGLFTVSLFCPSLYYGMLAWSAWHMAAVNDSSLPGCTELLEYAKKKHQACCDSLFPNLDFINVEDDKELEAVYCALFVCGQFKVVTCAPTSQVRVVVDAIDKIHRRVRFSSSSSPLVQRMGSILSQYDVRSSLFGIHQPVFTLRLGADLFESKVTSTDHASSVGVASVLHLHYLEAKCNDLERRLRDARASTDMTTFRRITREGDDLYEQITNLEPTFDPPRLAQFGTSIPHDLIDQNATSTALNTISQDECYELVLSSTFHGVVIHVSRILNYPVPARSIDRAIGLAYTVTSRNPEVVHSILAIPMFFAAVATTDKNQLEQVMNWINLRSGATSGTIGKTRSLLLEVKQSEKEGTAIDIGRLMSQARYDFMM